MLSNSVAAACLATAYVLLVVAQLNPTLPLQAPQLAPLATHVGSFYVIHLTVLFYVLLVVCQLFAREVFSPAWISVAVLGWLGVLAAAAGAALMGANASRFERVLGEAAVAAMWRGAAALVLASIAFVTLAWARRRVGPRPRVLWAAVLVLIAAASIAVPLAVRGRGAGPMLDARLIDAGIDVPRGDHALRLRVIAVDAGSLDYIRSATAEGRLPNFGRILDAGAVVHLATIHPTSPDAVWAAVATGKLPQKNGVRSAGIYHPGTGGSAVHLLPAYCFAYEMVRFGFLSEEPHTSATLRTRALWDILSRNGLSVGAVAWPLMQPAPIVRGYVVGDTYLRLAATPSGFVDSPAVYPPDAQDDVRLAMDDEDAPEATLGLPALDERDETPARVDRTYERIARVLAEVRPTAVVLTRYQSLDPIGHHFLRYAVPSAFGEVGDEEHRALGSVLDRHYRLIDEAVGRAIKSLGPDDLLLVVSGFGMEPMGMGQRVVERLIGDPDLNGTHDAAPDGFLMAYGRSVARGRPVTRASVVDVTPTILYFLGLPVGRDMDGYARTDLFERTLTDERPITFIPTYDR